MKWALTEATNQFHSWKLELPGFTAELKFNKKAYSFRIAANDKRLFFIEKTGMLQNKFLVRTEYSLVVGEVYPLRNWHSGIATLESRKYNYWLKDNFLFVASKKEDFTMAIEVNDLDKADHEEFCALLFGAIRITAKSYKTKEETALA